MSNTNCEWHFWSRVEVRDKNQCWPWREKLSNSGYGSFSMEGMLLGAHVWAWKFSGGLEPDGQCVLHRCDNRSCCNPFHMFLGSMSDNSQDAWEKGRNILQRAEFVRPAGEKHVNAKLTAKQVARIRELYRDGKYYQHELALKFGVSQGLISQIVRGVAWKGGAR